MFRFIRVKAVARVRVFWQSDQFGSRGRLSRGYLLSVSGLSPGLQVPGTRVGKGGRIQLACCGFQGFSGVIFQKPNKNQWTRKPVSSCLAKGNHRVHFRRAPGWQVAGKNGNGK